MSQPSFNPNGHKNIYDGHCHCHAVHFRAAFPHPIHASSSSPEAELQEVFRCNCSICERNGYLLIYPREEDLEVTAGKDKLKEYRCHSKTRPHLFCSECGSSVMIEQKPWKQFAVNLRMLDGVELEKLKFTELDGKNDQ
ncbi:hypothetical protein K461DRAFT_321097 [Myriangium duriaei CBS 260.36]|uniref:CENP-V/GFA domain-containing protein n=1 Tax=Myriangium duriaei CBS 260.36 TaxID=1168546 RepID=A0A9P4J2C9_9PEZI|nr:hypothetical protein K461DRAFT_321097 [Myriangium duriaei CBS 260.36]